MKAVILFNPNSEHSRLVEDFNRNLEMRSGRKLDTISTETIEGANLSELYGVYNYPAIIITRDDGALVNMWQNEHLPLINEVIGYLNS